MDTVLSDFPPDSAAPTDAADHRPYYSISQAAALLGVSRVTVWRWISSGQLPVVRLGHRTTRIKREDLARLLAARECGGPRSWAVESLGATAGRNGAGAGVALQIPAGTGGHVVQFYEADEVLLDAVSAFVGDGLRAGEAAIVLATDAHRAGLEARLQAAGLDLAALAASGGYLARNAAEALLEIMEGDRPAPARFAAVVEPLLERAAAGGRPVRIFGEMVALLLADDRPAAALRLEALWNRLQATRSFALLCAYPMGRLAGAALADFLGEVCAEHGRIVPAESVAALAESRDRQRAIVLLQQKARTLQAEVARRERAEERLQATVERAQRHAAFLSAASGALAESLDFETTLGQVARLAVPDLADWCVIELVETNDAGETRLRHITAASAGHPQQPPLPQRQPTVLDAAPRDPPLPRPLLRGALPTPNPGADAPRPPRLGPELTVPLVAPGRALGALTLARALGRSFDQDDLALAEELARRCAMAIVNARAFAAEEAARHEAQRAADRTRRLQEITSQLSSSLESDQVLAQVARSAADLLQAPVGAVFLFDHGDPQADFVLAAAHGIAAERATSLRLPRHASLAGRALDEGRTLVVDDVRGVAGTALPALLTGESAGSEIAAPIVAGETPLGVVKAFSPSVRRFRADDAALLTTLAAAAAAALTNARLYREAQEAVRVRDEFLSAAAHDLKTPLTSVKGMAQLLRRQLTRLPLADGERLLSGLASIDAAATKMGHQLDELLDVTRLQEGEQLELRRRPTDLVVLARRVAAEQQHAADRHVRVQASLPALVGSWDEVRLGRVLDNLLSNAIKYSPDGGEVVVSVTREAHGPHAWAVLAVTDHGLGIPAADLPRVFERFQRGANVHGRIGGSGIGLASARQIVEQHGGTISVQSTEGAGSTFTVRLPLAHPADAPASQDPVIRPAPEHARPAHTPRDAPGAAE